MESEPLLSHSNKKASPEYEYSRPVAGNSDPENGSRSPRRLRKVSASGKSCSLTGDDGALRIQQAVVFIEDAMQYRSINHRVDSSSLYLYRYYYSRICQWSLGLTIALLLALAFVEQPSSLSYTSDPRFRPEPWQPVCGLTESIEMVCLLIFSADVTIKGYLIGWDEFRKSKWLMGYLLAISVSVIDWTLSISMVCDENLRVRRYFRPFFLLQNSSLMKKTLKCLKRTLPEIASVILLLGLHLCLFTMIGMLLFAKSKNPNQNGEWEEYFRDLPRSFTSLLVLLTTANNPDVMIPAYSLNRGYSIFFILFSAFGTYFLMNLLTAIIYNQFRGYLLLSVQTSIMRRRLGIKAAFHVLQCQEAGDIQDPIERVHLDALTEVMTRVQMKSYYRRAIFKEAHKYSSSFIEWDVFKKLFDEVDKDIIKEHPPTPQYNSPILQRLQLVYGHYYTTVLGNVVALANVICICTILVLKSDQFISERDIYFLEVINCCFITYYLLEMAMKILVFGWRGYLSYKNNILDGFLTIILLVLQIVICITWKIPHEKSALQGLMSPWEMVRLVNMLIVFRFLRVIPDIKLMALVASTVVDLVSNLRAFAGILLVVYYVFALFGIWLFEGTITAPGNISAISNSGMENISSSFTMQCGSYEQLGYWPNNFDDFASAVVLLYNIMVVNNWQVFMDAYTRYTTEWSKVYFVFWWLTSSVMWVNLFVALILENFIYKWDRSHACTVTEMERTGNQTSVQLMFREQIQEPSEEELRTQLNQHPHLHLH